MKHENNFDFARYVAASLVIISHIFPLRGDLSEPLARWAGYGTFGGIGVAIFFSISGFLTTQSWCRDPNALRFIERRAIRILPGLAGVVAFSALVLGPIFTTIPITRYLSDPVTWSYFWNVTAYDIRFFLPGVFEANPSHAGVRAFCWRLRA